MQARSTGKAAVQAGARGTCKLRSIRKQDYEHGEEQLKPTSMRPGPERECSSPPTAYCLTFKARKDSGGSRVWVVRSLRR